jgi:SAM-dependent methyltransferase
MTTEHVTPRAAALAPASPIAPTRALSWATAPEVMTGGGDPSTTDVEPARTATLEAPRLSVDEDLVEIAANLPPGKALDIGCGAGQNAIWLAQRGWVVTAVDVSPRALAEAGRDARDAAVTIAFELADATAWRPASRFDLVMCTFALPPRGMGRSRLLEMAATAVAPGGTILVSELDVALAREGRMAEKYLVSRDEVERHLDGFRVARSRTRLARRPHGYEEIVVPVATVVATRRSDLRSPW